jgi:hypothetical protein
MKFGDAMIVALLIQIPLIPIVAFVDWINPPESIKTDKVVCYYQGGFGHWDDPTVYKYTTALGMCDTTHEGRYFLKKEDM